MLRDHNTVWEKNGIRIVRREHPQDKLFTPCQGHTLTKNSSSNISRRLYARCWVRSKIASCNSYPPSALLLSANLCMARPAAAYLFITARQYPADKAYIEGSSLQHCSPAWEVVTSSQPSWITGSLNNKAMITLQDLEDMFANMRAKTKWDIDGEMLWGYFFTDLDPKKLERVVQPLTNAGCRFVSIYETDDKSTHFLHVERVEKHTAQTLHARNAEFYSLADQYGLESYDGMDVGPVEKSE